MLASLGVAGFILGFALQDSLSNFAAGAMILFYQPFDVGDVVEAGGVSGKVRHLSLVSTTILTFDNQKLIVPNRKIWGDVIRNVTAEKTRRVDLAFAVRYQEDVDRALDALRAVAAAEERILSEPAPLVKVNDLSQGRVDLILRPWVKTPDYWGVYWDLNRAVKERFDAEGILLAVPQREVQLRQDGPTAT
jgi:small conductance mechanosensitive channel